MPGDKFPSTGRIIGVDYGLARIGLAITDPERIFCSPLEVYNPKNERKDAAFFKQLIELERVVAVVVGLPLHLNGNESEMSAKCRKFAKWLHETVALPVRLYDERFSSSIAEDHLQMGGLTAKKRKQRRDMLAAQVLLQGFVESKGAGAEAVF